MLAEPGRWSGKPVRIRRGPATVTGEATAGRRARRRPLGPLRPGKARTGRPGSQETSLRPPSRHNPRGKGWLQHEAQSHRRHGRRTPLVRNAGARGIRPRRPSGSKAPTRPSGGGDARLTTAAPVSKAGHDCSGTSAGGALDRATGGDWDAGWFDGLEHFVKTIRGETPAGDDYWSVWLNHKAVTVSACKAELQEGDDVLYFVDRCTFDGTGCSNQPVEPLALTAPVSATAGATGEVTVVKHNAAGAAEPVAGAKVAGRAWT